MRILKPLLIISVIGNLSFLSYYLYKKYQFVQSTKAISYNDNWQFLEQTSIFPAYTSPCKIAFLGDSYIYKVHLDELLNKQVCNRGIGSDILKGMYSRIDGIIKLKPELVFICGGSNDASKGVPIDTSLFYYNKILSDLRSNNIRPVIFTIPPTLDTTGTGKLINDRINALNTKIRELSAEIINIDYEEKDYQEDRLHLTASGYLKWKAAIDTYVNTRIQ